MIGKLLSNKIGHMQIRKKAQRKIAIGVVPKLVLVMVRLIAVLDIMLSDEALQVYTETNRVISPSKNVEVDCIDALKPVNELVNEGIFVLGSNAGMKLEQWGNTCLVVREMLDGASVEECLEEMDRLQGETIQN